MKISLFLAITIGTMLAGVTHAQAPVAVQPQTPLQRLEQMKEKNKALIDRQKETLKQLEALELAAQQLKFMGRRN